MEYSIKNFICTQLGMEQLTNATKTVSISDDEILILELIHNAQHTSDVNKLYELKSTFDTLYQEINLTGLVVLKLIEFNQDSLNHEEVLLDLEKHYDFEKITKKEDENSSHFLTTDKDIELTDIDLNIELNIELDIKKPLDFPLIPSCIHLSTHDDLTESDDLTNNNNLTEGDNLAGIDHQIILASGVLNR